MAERRRRPRAVVDTSVLAAGIAGFRLERGHAITSSGRLLRDWVEKHHFVWLISEDILSEYKRVLSRLKVGRSLIGSTINQLRERAEFIEVRRSRHLSPDPGDDPVCDCAEAGRADFIFTLNPRHFPQDRLAAKVVVPG